MPSNAPSHQEQAPPRHVAIIMDGNGRWAKARHLPRVMGHRAGVAAVRATVRAAADLGIEYLTLYGFSSENWKRPRTEVNDLMGLLRLYIHDDLEELHASGVEIRVIGAKTHLEGDIIEPHRACAERARAATPNSNSSSPSTMAARTKSSRPRAASPKTSPAGKIAPQAVDRELFTSYLATAGIPDPDLVIRTSGERRLSNFLIWQTAYSEFVFTDTLWPDFTKAHLAAAISEFQGRDRRFGGLSLAAGGRT